MLGPVMDAESSVGVVWSLSLQILQSTLRPEGEVVMDGPISSLKMKTSVQWLGSK